MINSLICKCILNNFFKNDDKIFKYNEYYVNASFHYVNYLPYYATENTL